jgi:hypothetical protein
LIPDSFNPGTRTDVAFRRSLPYPASTDQFPNAFYPNAWQRVKNSTFGLRFVLIIMVNVSVLVLRTPGCAWSMYHTQTHPRPHTTTRDARPVDTHDTHNIHTYIQSYTNMDTQSHTYTNIQHTHIHSTFPGTRNPMIIPEPEPETKTKTMCHFSKNKIQP